MIRFVLFLIFTLFQQASFAAVYKCEKGGGKVEYQATPCMNARQSELQSPPSPSLQTATSLEGKKQCVGKELSLAFANAPVGTILNVIADFSGKKLSIAPSVSGSGAFYYVCVPWDSVLTDIASKYKLSIKIENETIIVHPR